MFILLLSLRKFEKTQIYPILHAQLDYEWTWEQLSSCGVLGKSRKRIQVSSIFGCDRSKRALVRYFGSDRDCKCK